MCFSISNCSSNLTIFGWRSYLRMAISLFIFFFEHSSFIYSFCIDLIATSLLVSLCKPILTLPKAPFPSILPILYSSTYVFGAFPYLVKHSLINETINVISFFLGDYLVCPLLESSSSLSLKFNADFFFLFLDYCIY